MIKTAIVTGATGFIGEALVRRLICNGVFVYAVSRNAEKLRLFEKDKNVEIICADFKDYLMLDTKIGKSADVFFHCAYAGGFGSTALKDYNLQLDNTKYTCDAVMAAIQLNCRKFVLASTVNTVEVLTLLKKENFRPRYTCIYSSAKLISALIGKTLSYNNGMSFCTALIAMPYGEKNYADTLPNVVIRQLENGISPKLIEGNNLYDLIYIDDVTRGLQAIAEKGKNLKDYYLGHRKLFKFRDWMTKMRDIVSPTTKLLFGEYPDSPTVDYDLIDLDALFLETGFECQSDFDESIRKTAKWLAEQKEKEGSKA